MSAHQTSLFHRLADRFGATASFLCAVHCALLPLVIAALPAIGLGFLARPWLSDPAWALPTVIAVQCWNVLGWAIIIYLSGLQSIRRSCSRRPRSTARPAGSASDA